MIWPGLYWESLMGRDFKVVFQQFENISPFGTDMIHMDIKVRQWKLFSLQFVELCGGQVVQSPVSGNAFCALLKVC